MFLMINNVAFKCTEMNVSRMMSTDRRFCRVMCNIHCGTAKFDDEEYQKQITLMLDELKRRGDFDFKLLDSDDERAHYSKFEVRDENGHLDFGKMDYMYELSPTEYVIYNNDRGAYLETHPEGVKHLFCVYDNSGHMVVSRLYDTEEECQEAYEDILLQCNNIVYELPKKWI